jgi:small-conductance mechanosensitive channel
MGAMWEFLRDTTVFDVSLAELVGKAILVVVVSLIAYIADRGLSRVVRHVLEHAKVPSVSFIVNIMRGVIWSLALMTVLEPVFGVQPTAFVAALGVGSVALSLGLQDTMSNIIGGLALMTSKVIKPGDMITFAGFTGTVTDINWRATCVVDSYGQVNIIPNSVISKTAVVKLSAATRDCCVMPLAVEHGSDMEEVRRDLKKVAVECLGEWVDPKRDVWVTVVNFDPGAINAQISVPLMHGVSADHARTRLATGLTKRPWVRKP